jgi:hypothetical protein
MRGDGASAAAEHLGSPVDYDYELPELEYQLAKVAAFDDLEAVMQALFNVPSTFNAPEIYGQTLFCPGLDALIGPISRRLNLTAPPMPKKSNDNVCMVATRFYATGGHTRVAKDIIKGLGAEASPCVILSNTLSGSKVAYRGVTSPDGGLGARSCLILSAPTLVERAIELHMMLLSIRPTRIILMCHPFDIVSILGTWAFRDVVEFIHHADHVPAIGATLPYSSHVDVTYTCHCACRARGLDAVYSGMTSDVVEAPPRERDPKRVRIATCGNKHKYDRKGRYRWADYVVAALRTPGTEIFHIGPVEPEFEKEVRTALRKAGIEQKRYEFAGGKPSLPDELIAQGIDIYLSSYPETGGKSNLEAMLVDLPVILPFDKEMPELVHFSLPLPRYIEINTPGEMRGAIAKALELREALGSPEHVAIRDREVARFHDYVAGRRPAPATPDALGA